MSLLTVVILIIGMVLVYSAVKGVDPRVVFKQALRKG